MNDFYERVKTLAKSQNKNLRELIESCGMNYDSYNSYKRYGNLPRANEAVAIADALGTTVEYLVAGKDPQDKNEVIKEYLESLIQSL
jgi:transcriptional regulator with XRE-family HTH domain